MKEPEAVGDAMTPGVVESGEGDAAVREPVTESPVTLLRAIRRMYPTLARTAAAVSRLHRHAAGRRNHDPTGREET